MNIEPIAYIKTDFKSKFGIPRQSGRISCAVGTVVFAKEYRNPDYIKGISEFSHLWLLFDFSKSHRESLSPLVRPPRLGGNKKVGVYASRSPFRPNFIGLSSVKLIEVKKDEKLGYVLIVSGADLLDGTPIYDIKPYISYTDCHSDAVCSYADENKSHRLPVAFLNGTENLLSEKERELITECLADDPRPSYQGDGRIYKMAIFNKDISFFVKDNTLYVDEIKSK